MINYQKLDPSKLVPLIELMARYKRTLRIQIPPLHSLLTFFLPAFPPEQA
jgi:hypothetical protein